jgi:glycosyltransferase involved in cell wall biosynthesis
MRIGVDARFLTHPQAGGFKTYTTNLLTALADEDQDNEYIVYIDRHPPAHTQLPSGANFIIRGVPGSLPLGGMAWREQIMLPLRAAQDKLDILHSPSLSAPLYLNCRSVVTIHDMIWHMPKTFSKSNRLPRKRALMSLYYRYVPRLAARKAAVILTVSCAAKTSIVQHLGINPKNICVTHEAASNLYHQVDNLTAIEAVRRKYQLSSTFILAIGSADPRKNIELLVQAYAALPPALRETYQLAIVWTHDLLAPRLAAQVRELGVSHRIRFLKHVANDDLLLLYNAASLFVFPSRYEGFGLPLLESMACGTPVVAANNSSIPEITADAALLFETDNPCDLSKAIITVLTDDSLRAILIRKGLRRVSDFSWKNCARGTIAAYEMAHQNEEAS